MAVDTVVFDVGGVLIEWDPRHLYRKLLPHDAAVEAFLGEICTHAWNLEQDRGRSFEAAVEELATRHPDHRELIAAYHHRWEEMVPGHIPGSVQILENLAASGVPLYAITNFAADKFALTTARFPFFRHFRDIVISGDERVIKPDPAIYEILMERNGLQAERLVFIDDSLKNVEGARAVGMQAIHFASPEQLARELGALGIPVGVAA